ncbi:MAG: hypothetical protein H6650_17010 [Ardenticatenales bacterium]|nr:hypothetical protein [Ardenticatenales bacterium]
MNKEKAPTRGTNSNLLLGGILIALGILFLLGELFDIRLGAYAWPFFILIPGSVILMLGLGISDDSGGGLTIAGTIITTVGLLLLLQNITGLWASWSYAWALVAPTSVGLAQLLYGRRHHRDKMVADGQNLIRIGLIMFVVGFVFFELVIGISGFGLGSFGWPILLIMVGSYLLLRNVWHGRRTL